MPTPEQEQYEDEKGFLNNRQKIHDRITGGGWCPSCDAAIVTGGAKCPICHNVAGVIKRKKHPKTV